MKKINLLIFLVVANAYLVSVEQNQANLTQEENQETSEANVCYNFNNSTNDNSTNKQYISAEIKLDAQVQQIEKKISFFSKVASFVKRTKNKIQDKINEFVEAVFTEETTNQENNYSDTKEHQNNSEATKQNAQAKNKDHESKQEKHVRICPTCGFPAETCELDKSRIAQGIILKCGCKECGGRWWI